VSIAIDQAFDNAMLTGGLNIDLVHDNGAYSTWSGFAYDSFAGVYSSRGAHAILKLFPSLTSGFSLKDTDSHVGFFQIALRYPIDAGVFQAKTKAEEILALFPVGGKISYAGQEVHILSNNRDGGNIEGEFFETIIRINYRAFVTR